MELIEKLKSKISIAFDNGCDVNDADFLITVKEAANENLYEQCSPG
jgi:hypothetical protein